MRTWLALLAILMGVAACYPAYGASLARDDPRWQQAYTTVLVNWMNDQRSQGRI